MGLWTNNFIIYNVEGDPLTFEEAMQSKDAILWKKVIDNEMDLLIQNHTWKFVDMSEGAKPINCK